MEYVDPVSNQTEVLLRGRKWEECSDDVFDHWPTADMYGDTVALYQEIHEYVTKHRKDTPFRMLVYSGDADGVSRDCHVVYELVYIYIALICESCASYYHVMLCYRCVRRLAQSTGCSM